jgi:hypothetical protein
MTEITRETVERWLSHSADSFFQVALARSWLEKDAMVEDVECCISSEPCLPHKTPLGLKMNEIMAKLETLSPWDAQAEYDAAAPREPLSKDEIDRVVSGVMARDYREMARAQSHELTEVIEQRDALRARLAALSKDARTCALRVGSICSHCGQCGQEWWTRACGPTHALVWSEIDAAARRVLAAT